MYAQLLSRVRLSVTPGTLHSPPGSSLHGSLQARILEWVAISFSKGSSQPGIESVSPALQAYSLPLSHLGSLPFNGTIVNSSLSSREALCFLPQIIFEDWKQIWLPKSLTQWLCGKEPAWSAGDARLIPGSGRSLGGANSSLFQYSCWENSTDRGAWWATVHGVSKSQTQLSDSTHTHKGKQLLRKWSLVELRKTVQLPASNLWRNGQEEGNKEKHVCSSFTNGKSAIDVCSQKPKWNFYLTMERARVDWKTGQNIFVG